ncbi:hypothetical protein [Streptomyces apocyni]|uniref:hypothetical protein n=1 Tax=Streptomyces apocyni TaxID=2654677 RepID=UPI0012EA583C|nr:hypothetical protein [Streptomyces apocyni]
MQTRSAMEIARAALREIFPTAPEDGLDEGARHLTRWGVEGHGTMLGSSEAALMYMDLVRVSQENYEFVPEDVAVAAEVRGTARTWRAPSRPD